MWIVNAAKVTCACNGECLRFKRIRALTITLTFGRVNGDARSYFNLSATRNGFSKQEFENYSGVLICLCGAIATPKWECISPGNSSNSHCENVSGS